MLKNFIIITLRNLAAQKVYAFINIFGLALGLAAVLLISTYLVNELSYDDFHRDADRIYRVCVKGKLRGSELKIAVTSLPMAGKLTEEYPDIEASMRVARFGAWLVSNGTVSFNEDKLLYADPQFFSFFSFTMISGNADSALIHERSIVLTRSTAMRYFGREDVVGQNLWLEKETVPYKITGVVEDVPSNTHMHFDMIGSLSTLNRYLRPVWVSHNIYTYIRVKPNTNVLALESKLNNLVPKYVIPQAKEYLHIPVGSFADGLNIVEYFLQPLQKIHINSNLDNELEANGSSVYMYSFAIIAFLILLIACLNFINISTANAVNRAREVVLRKVMGSERRLLVFQFLTESVLISFFALAFALLIAELCMPWFNSFLHVDLRLQTLNTPFIILAIIMGALMLGLLAGCYPAFFIASFDPIKVLQGKLSKGIKNRKVRTVFVVIQLSISVLIISLAWVVYAQVEYMLNTELGFTKQRILVIRRPDALKEQIADFKAEILKHPNIESVTNSNSIPGRDFLASTFTLDEDTSRENILMSQIFVNYDFCEAFKLQMQEGRFFSPDIPSDSAACVINEEAARMLGPQSIAGSHLLTPALKEMVGERLKIIGVIKDFHFASVDKRIGPLVFTLMPGNWEGYLNVRLSSEGIDRSIKYIGDTWNRYTHNFPFQYFFLDQDFDRNYRSVVNTGKMLFLFALLSVFLACLGLFGLVLFTTNHRIQEIGIRKALGATYYQIILMMVGETAMLNVFASVFAWLAAWLISMLWLKDFYSRITLSPKYFIFSSAIVLMLSILVVFFQAYHGSKRDPVTALKAE
jgi:putative ABC transport system permease protein